MSPQVLPRPRRRHGQDIAFDRRPGSAFRYRDRGQVRDRFFIAAALTLARPACVAVERVVDPGEVRVSPT